MKKRRIRKGLLSIVLTAALVLTVIPLDIFTLETKAANEEVTKTYSFNTAILTSDYLSIKATDPDDSTQKSILTVNGTMNDVFINSSNTAFDIINLSDAADASAGHEVQLFISPHINGKVTKVEFTKAGRSNFFPGESSFSMSIDGMKYNGTDASLTGVGTNGESTSFTFISTDASGIDGNLTMRLGVHSQFSINKNDGCELKITYIPAAEPAHEHDFTYSKNGNTLTATCGHSDGRSCSLADSNHQISVSLEAEDAYYQFGYVYPATLLNNSLFASETGATIGNITYRNNTTGEDLGTQNPTGSGEHPTGAGNYTASVTITVGGTTYTLTKDYTLSNFYTINNSYPQFSFGTENYLVVDRAAENEIVTITFTPQYGETLKSLSVKGETTNYSLENGITKVDDTHYTFSMPAETVTIDASFTCNISIDNTIQHGSVTASVGITENATTATNGDTVILNVTPDEGYELEGLTVTKGDTYVPTTAGENNIYTFTMPAGNVTVRVEFREVTISQQIPTFESHTLLLSGQIGVNFYMDLSMLTAEERAAAVMEFTINGKKTTDTFDAGVTNPSTHTYNGFTCYINAAQMADEITAVLKYGDGETVSQTYSVSEYIQSVNDHPEGYSRNAIELVHAIADYGHYVQPFLASNNNWTLGTDHAVMNAYSVYDDSCVQAARDAVSGKGIIRDTGESMVDKVTFSLSLESETTLNIYLKMKDGFTGDVTASIGGNAVDVLRQSDGRYRIQIKNISADNLDDTYGIEVSAGGSFTISVSALSYVNTVLNSDSSTFDNDTARFAVTSIYRYYLATENYAENPTE